MGSSFDSQHEQLPCARQVLGNNLQGNWRPSRWLKHLAATAPRVPHLATFAPPNLFTHIQYVTYLLQPPAAGAGALAPLP